MQKIKKYQIGENQVECLIHYGFDKELLLNHPKDSIALHMFINSKDYDKKWFDETENTNLNISVMIVDIKDDSEFHILERIVDKIYEMQNQAYIALKKSNLDYENTFGIR